jgi:hypothetical protein
MPVETFDYVDSLDPNNPQPFDSVSSGDDHIRGVKSTIKSTFPNITGPVTVTQDELNSLSGIASRSNGIFASLKVQPGTGNIMYGQNISSVSFENPASCRVDFTQPTDGFDNHYAVLLQSYADITNNGYNPCFATITEQYSTYVRLTFTAVTGPNSFGAPSQSPGFSLLMVDMIQTEANANQ